MKPLPHFRHDRLSPLIFLLQALVYGGPAFFAESVFMIMISACLFGLPCRYDGQSKENPHVRLSVHGMPVLVICPEQLGNLSTPRPSACLSGGDGKDVLSGRARVIRPITGEDVTDAFLYGADRVVHLAQDCGITQAILKEKSPSCGAESVYIDGELRPGIGVTTARLLQAGIQVESA